MFIEIPTIERGATQINPNNIEDIFSEGEQTFIQFVSGKEFELDTSKMSKVELMTALG